MTTRSIGTSLPLGADELAPLHNGLIKAEVSDLAKPENRYERQFGKLLEVYLPIRIPDGSRLLFEAYFRYDAVSASGGASGGASRLSPWVACRPRAAADSARLVAWPPAPPAPARA